MDSGWIKALELPAKITGGLFVACGTIWFLDDKNALNLDEIAAWVQPVIVILWIGSGCLFGASLVGDAWSFGANALQKRVEKQDAIGKETLEKEALEARRSSIIAHLDRLSEKEIFEAAKALKGGSPSFESWAHSTGAGQLLAKGLIYSPQGSYNQDYFPFTFHDFVWEALEERRDTILAKEVEYERKRNTRR